MVVFEASILKMQIPLASIDEKVIGNCPTALAPEYVGPLRIFIVRGGEEVTNCESVILLDLNAIFDEVVPSFDTTTPTGALDL
jgi:hypothetical protein